MTKKSTKLDVKILEPILESDFKEALRIVDDNLAVVMSLSELENEPVGRLHLAKIDNKVAGVLNLKFPGEELSDYEEKCITLDKINAERNEIGCVVVVAVDSKFQKMGIGRKLIQKGLRELKKTGAKVALAHIWMSSPGGASKKSFESLGFEPVKLHEKIWFESSKKMGPEKYSCAKCGNPCRCDALEMIKYL